MIQPADARVVRRFIHPAIWLVLYIPFGALGGFVSVALTFLATRHGMSISEGALLNGANLLSQWLKWLWAPAVDITLTPKRWYVISTGLSAAGVLAMSIVPLGPATLPLLIAVIAIASLINSVVGMAVEAMISSLTLPEEIGRVSGWFQAGNLGGMGLGGGLGLLLIEVLPRPWMSGAIIGGIFMLCCLPLLALPHVKAHTSGQRPVAAMKSVSKGLWSMLRTRIGFLSALICILPVGTGAAQVVLTQANVASFWHAGAHQVELVQGLLAGLVTSVGCFAGGWVCHRLNARGAYMIFALVLAGIASLMAVSPATVTLYVGFSMLYAFGVGLAYAGFSAVALTAVGDSPAATGYNVFASLSNFPIWWLGLLLGYVADHRGAPAMLLTEAALGVVGVLIFAAVSRMSGERLFGRARAVTAPSA